MNGSRTAPRVGLRYALKADSTETGVAAKTLEIVYGSEIRAMGQESMVGFNGSGGLAAGLEIEETGGMKPPTDPHYRHRFPAEIISHAVWLYHVFSLSLRDVELLLAKRGIVVSYETVRRWCK
jgi:hypothetical protein